MKKLLGSLAYLLTLPTQALYPSSLPTAEELRLLIEAARSEELSEELQKEGANHLPDALPASPEIFMEVPSIKPWQETLTTETELAVSMVAEPLHLKPGQKICFPEAYPKVDCSCKVSQTLSHQDSAGVAVGLNLDDKDGTVKASKTYIGHLTLAGFTFRAGMQSSLLGKIAELSGLDAAHGRDDNLFGTGQSNVLILEPKPWGGWHLSGQLLFPQKKLKKQPHRGGGGFLLSYTGSHLTLGCAATAAQLKLDKKASSADKEGNPKKPGVDRPKVGLVIGGAQFKQGAYTVGLTGSFGKGVLPIGYKLKTAELLTTPEPESVSAVKGSGQKPDPNEKTPLIVIEPSVGDSKPVTDEKTEKDKEEKAKEDNKKTLNAETSCGAELWCQHKRKNTTVYGALGFQGCWVGNALHEALSIPVVEGSGYLPTQTFFQAGGEMKLTPWLSMSVTVARDLRDTRFMGCLKPEPELEALARAHDVGGKWPGTGSVLSLKPWSMSLKFTVALSKFSFKTTT